MLGHIGLVHYGRSKEYDWSIESYSSHYPCFLQSYLHIIIFLQHSLSIRITVILEIPPEQRVSAAWRECILFLCAGVRHRFPTYSTQPISDVFVPLNRMMSMATAVKPFFFIFHPLYPVKTFKMVNIGIKNLLFLTESRPKIQEKEKVLETYRSSCYLRKACMALIFSAA